MKLSQVWNELKVGDIVDEKEFSSLCRTMGVQPTLCSPSHTTKFFLYRLKRSDAKETALSSSLKAFEKLRDTEVRDWKPGRRKGQKLSTPPQPPALTTPQSSELDDLTIGRSIIQVIKKLETKVKEQNEELAQLVEEKTQLTRQCTELKEKLCKLNQQKSGSTISLHRLQELVNGGLQS